MKKDKYTDKAQVYSNYRSSYPIKCVKELLQKTNLKDDSAIADIGAGTGIFTKMLFEKDFTIYAIESNEDMFKELKKLNYKKLKLIHSIAEDTTLYDESIDLIVVAQAFHWFDKEKFKKECKRILKPNSYIALLWNEIDYSTDIANDILKLVTDFTDGEEIYRINLQNDDSLVNGFFYNNSFDKKSYNNNMELTRKKFIGNYLSKSYAPIQKEKRYKEYLKKLNEIFDKHSKNDTLSMLQKTFLYIGKI